ncbi:MAG: sulfatase [Akkermansiaceae bacterium]|nr:sulfatase [Akkermansiaceae bacterium]MCP5546248.1 sulfatase [Akkermansiaceae bacterium]
MPNRRPRPAAAFLPVLAGAIVFFAVQYGMALWKLNGNTGGMSNKFSALAREQYLGFIIRENLRMLAAYAVLALAAALLIQPIVSFWTSRSRLRGRTPVIARAFLLTFLLHGFCVLRLVKTRPYFLNEAEFGHWYFKMLDWIPDAAKPAAMLVIFGILPVAWIVFAIGWHLRKCTPRRRIAGAVVVASVLLVGAWSHFSDARTDDARPSAGRAPNVIIIGSDSLRGDRLGFAGYVPKRRDGEASDGVSPVIDGLAARSAVFTRCHTSIASTLESGIQLLNSAYPHTHGVRQMYPDKENVEDSRKRITSLATLLRERGYDTAAIGDWCASYYHVMPMGMEHISVSSFDNFKIYMSQAVVMSHFVVPLYFDNPLGYRLFPELQSFAQFVTPALVNRRVDERMRAASENGKPFFWHVFYSCNHLPYRSKEPYASMFADPAYDGPNKSGVDFDIDEFIGGTDLESKWKALPPAETDQIRALYDGCTRQFDDCVSHILDSLETHGLADNTIVIVTADHGDDLYEPGATLGHGLTFNGGAHSYHVPMVVHVPGAEHKVIPQTVRLIDVAPTVAELLDVEIPDRWEGRSFAGWINGRETPADRPVYAETGFPFIQFTVPGVERPPLPPMDELTTIDPAYNYQFVLKREYLDRLIAAKQRSLTTARWRIICTPTADGGRHFQLFHIPDDPFGERDLATTRPDVLAPMRSALEAWIDKHEETPVEEIFPQGEP